MQGGEEKNTEILKLFFFTLKLSFFALTLDFLSENCMCSLERVITSRQKSYHEIIYLFISRRHEISPILIFISQNLAELKFLEMKIEIDEVQFLGEAKLSNFVISSFRRFLFPSQTCLAR